jgi:hypothetical protein
LYQVVSRLCTCKGCTNGTCQHNRCNHIAVGVESDGAAAAYVVIVRPTGRVINVFEPPMRQHPLLRVHHGQPRLLYDRGANKLHQLPGSGRQANRVSTSRYRAACAFANPCHGAGRAEEGTCAVSKAERLT